MEILRWLVHLLISPYTHLALLILGLLLSVLLKKQKWARIIAIIFSAWIFLFILLPIPDWWVRHFENQYAPIALSQVDTTQDYAIIILGSGKTSDPDLPALTQLGESATLRLTEGVRIYRQLPVTCFFTSGRAYDNPIPQAQVTADAAVSLGVAPFDTLQLNSTINTQSEAQQLAAILSADRPIILVTSAIHMPRAVYWFEYYGLEVIPAPTDYMIKDDPTDTDYFWKGWGKRVEFMQKAMHEAVGLLYAKGFD